MLDMRKFYTLSLDLEVPKTSLTSLSTSYHTWGPGPPKSSGWSFIVDTIVSSTQTTSQGHLQNKGPARSSARDSIPKLG